MKKILSILLTLCMIVSMLPVSAMAEEIHTPIGTSGEIIAFEPLAETEKSVSLGTSIEDLEFPETVTATVRTAVPIGEDSVQDSEWVENTMDIPVRRTSEPEYDMDTEDVYVFAPVIEGYTVSAPLPQVTVTVGEMPSIAAVVLDSGGAAKDSYDTFENALDHAETGETVKLLKEITLAAPASITDKSIILDLNGKKLTSAWPQTLTYTGTSDKTLTITDSADGGVVENTYGPKEGKALVNNRTGTVEILGGTIRSTGVYGYGIHNASTGTITVSGGSVEATGDQYASMYYYRARAIDNSGGGVVNISGTAQVTGVTGNGYAITSNKASGVVNISGGVVSSENNFALGGSESGRIKGRVNITGGEIRSGIDLANGTTVNISGGTLAPGKISVPVDSTLVITGGNMGFNLYGGVAVNGQVPPVTVVPYVLTIPGEGNKAVTELTVTPELDYTYGMNDVKTDDNGNLTVCLPLGKTGVSVTIDGTTYSGETVRVSEEDSNRGYTATLTPPAPSYTVTFNPNGGTVTETSRSIAPGAAVGALPTPTRSGSYNFDGWYTAASGGTQISASTTVNANVTYYAHWTYTGGGGSGSGGGSSSNDKSSSVIVTPPAPDKPNSPTQGEIKVSGTVDSKGNITVNITGKTVTDAFDKALAEAKKNGTEQNGIAVILRVDTGSKTGSNVTVNLPKTVQDTIIAQKIVNTIVVVDNPDIRIGMDLATVKEINKQAKSDVNITATRGDSGKLTADAKKAIGGRPVFDLKVNYGNGKAVSSFGAGSVSVTIPYTLGTGENAGNIQAVYVDAKGKVHWLVNSVYDSLNGVLRFSTNHFSTYGVGYKQGAPVFTDVSTHWAADDIAFVVSRGLFSGTSATTFSPNTAMTRGMFVTALGRLANANVSGYTKSSFTDVKSDAYYMGYIEWASKNGIVNGVGNGKFAPDQSITREQMAVIISNYAKAIGFALPKARAEIIFADNTKISAYAKEAVKQMQMAGVISGKNGNLFDPQGTATRAEVAAVLRRFVELAISSDTAQGWTMNDSGKWMYFENGKPLTGKQNIGGSTYTFDQYGVTADVPKNLKYTTYTVKKGDSFWLIAHKLGYTMSELERLNNKSRFDLIYPGDVLRVPEK